MRLVSIVMGSPSVKAREDASAALINYGYTFFETSKIRAARDTVLKPRVYKSSGEFAAIGIPYDLYVTVARDQVTAIKTNAHLTKEPLVAPLPANQPVGEFTVADGNGEILAKAPLVPLATVAEGGLWTRAVDDVALWFK
jgi:D-alanyl-D-alanine carboxypeptidase (penicillin-binding protein 5/6)